MDIRYNTGRAGFNSSPDEPFVERSRHNSEDLVCPEVSICMYLTWAGENFWREGVKMAGLRGVECQTFPENRE